jgi:hypothetical protein
MDNETQEKTNMIQNLETLQKALESGSYKPTNGLVIKSEEEIISETKEKGIVLNFFRISLASTLVGSKTSQERIEDEVNLILSVMPKGTKFVSAEEIGMMDLSVPYVLKFHHPLFEGGTKIELDFARDVYFLDTPDDSGETVKTVNILLGMKYIKPDGTPKYSHV